MTDKSREAFEAWYQADIVNWSLRFDRTNGKHGAYAFSGTEKAWQAWRQSRIALLEELKSLEEKKNKTVTGEKS